MARLRRHDDNSQPVYSTESGRLRPPEDRQPATAAAGDGIVRVSRETKGRGGKAVTVVRGLALEAASLVKLAQQLKSTCGSGGTVKDGTIEVQGDHCDKVMALLKGQGHAVKRAGG